MGVFIHPRALCESTSIGEGTSVGAFSHVLAGAVIGRDCRISDHVLIESDVVVGERVTIQAGVHLWAGARLEDDVFVGPHVAFTNEDFPPGRAAPLQPLATLVRRGASLGANCTLLPGLTIGERAVVGAGSVVTRDVPPMATVIGVPARIVGYRDATRRNEASSPVGPRLATDGGLATGVPGVTLHPLPRFRDLRGSLSVGEFEREIPFLPLRYFVVFGVSSKEVRGEHAHKECDQFLISIHGSCAVVVDNGSVREEIRLDRPDLGVRVPPMTWCVQYKATSDAVLLVFASHRYDPADYIRDYTEFLEAVRGGAKTGSLRKAA